MSYAQGSEISATETGFHGALKAALDYRGDITLIVKNRGPQTGYLFNLEADALDWFPSHANQPERIPLAQIERLIFSGVDTAAGKSWDEWVKKRAQNESQRADG